MPDEYPKYDDDIPYSDASSLNTLSTCLPYPPKESSNPENPLWIVYIHGGAWRDPTIPASSFSKARDILIANHAQDRQIAGLASINYRLSPYPSHSTDPSNPADPARNARHPDHITDVLAALLQLQETHAFGENYILVGHSCGATLALQVAMRRFWGTQYDVSSLALEMNVLPPLAIVAVEGIYHLPALLEAHTDQPVYGDIVENAFGQSDYKAVSPAAWDWEGSGSWDEGLAVVLAHSREDELVEWEQVELMKDSLKGWSAMNDGRVKLIEVKGKHDEVWEEGTELARAIEAAFELTVSKLASRA
ncbi:hypothetical protein MBLNU230_g4462t1 [Neophaeotheca triangularis]